MENQPLIGSAAVGRFHPTSSLFRYTLLIIIALICFGSYFTYDEIQPSQYRDNFNGYITDSRFGLLYSVYSIPNTVLVFFGGIVGDKIGLRLAGMIFVSLCLAGSVLVALGSTMIGVLSPASGYMITILGRVVFGCGAESLNVIQNSMIARWFSGGRELAFAMGLSLSMSRLGDLFALSGTTYIVNWFPGSNFNWILWLGVILCGVSCVAVIIYSVVDKATEKYFVGRTQDPNENNLNFRAVLHFDKRFWLIAIVCMAYYGGIFPFTAICSKFLTQSYGMSDSKAGIYSGIVTLSSLVLSPFLGKFIDIVKMRPYFVVIGSLVVIPCHLYLAFMLAYPIVPIIFMGLSFSLVPAALWPSIPIVIKPAEVATAFGVMAAIQNSGLAAINALAGVLSDNYGYQKTMYFFVFMDCVGLIFGVALLLQDIKNGELLIGRTPVVVPQVENPSYYEESSYQAKRGINYDD